MVDRIDRYHPASRVPIVRTAAFLGGLFAIAVALMSGIERYDTTLFSVHMVQHLVLMLVAAPLIALSAPITQILRVASPRVRQRWILPILESGPIAVISHPAVTWLTFTAVLWFSHFSALFDAALGDPFIHDLEHGLFLGAALLFWWPVVALDPSPHRMGYPARIGYLLLQLPFSSFLAMVVLFAGAPLYLHYATLGAPYGISALSDQQLAAGIMWFVGDIVVIGAILVMVGLWMGDEERRSPAADRRADAQRAKLRANEARLAGRRLDEGQPPDGSGEASSAR
jgi:putative copper resistance protein D